MAGTGGNNQRSCAREKRGVSPIIGLVLLIGMVIAATALLLLIGSPMLDAFESESERERAYLCMDETDHQLATVAATGEQRSMPSTDISECQIDVADEGQIEFVWYNDTEAGDIPWDNDDQTASAKLGALEFELEDRTIAHQGGAIWEDTGSETRIVSEPGISYENEADKENRSVQFNIMLLDQDELSSSDPVARADHERSDELAENITNAASASDGNNVAIRIESSYHDGWNRYLEEVFNPENDDDVSLNYSSDTETVTATIDRVRDVDAESGIIVEEDHGLVNANSDYRIAETEPLEFKATLRNLGIEHINENVTLDIDNGPEHDKSVDLTAGDYSNESFTIENYNLDPGESHSYQYLFDDEELLNSSGSFYLGKEETYFEPSNTNATRSGGNVTISSTITNIGVENGTQNVGLELEYLDDLPGEIEDDSPYGYINETPVNLASNQSDTIDPVLNESKLLDGEYEATIHTENKSESVNFTVDAGIDPGRVGLGAVEDAEVTVEVLGSQVSGDGPWWQPEVHNLAPMTLDVLADDDSVHSFENPDGGDNINTGPTWQDKSDDSYRYNFSVDDEIELTLRNTRHNTCQAQSTDPDTLPHYSGPTDRDFMWCSDAPHGEAFGPIDASQGENLQNVRVRSAENNTIPALPAGNDQQQSATEVLEQQGLIADSGDELDLGPGEFVFLFENTISTGEEGIDALWDDAIDTYEQYPDQTYDPNFNDLIVYVEVERAGVDPSTPSITIQPNGNSSDDNPGPGDSGFNGGEGSTDETGIEIDTDHIVIG